MIYAQGANGVVTGTACPGGKVITAAGVTFNNPTGYLNSSGGSLPSGGFSLLQLIGTDVTSAANYAPGLDTRYPYPGGIPTNDSPSVYLPSNTSTMFRTFTANMFLMWTSSISGSIAVPLGYQQWGFSGTANCNSNCGTWSNWTVANVAGTTPGPVGAFVTSSPSQQLTNDGNNILVDGYPTWTRTSQ